MNPFTHPSPSNPNAGCVANLRPTPSVRSTRSSLHPYESAHDYQILDPFLELGSIAARERSGLISLEHFQPPRICVIACSLVLTWTL
jgi:hypothetical protein